MRAKEIYSTINGYVARDFSPRGISSELHSRLKNYKSVIHTSKRFEMISLESILLFTMFISLNKSDMNTLFKTLLQVNQEVFPSTASCENGTYTSADGRTALGYRWRWNVIKQANHVFSLGNGSA